MKNINIYLTFNGNCEKAFNLYKDVFGGEFTNFSRFKEMPPPEDNSFSIPEDQLERIMHVSLQINDNIILMGSDTGGEWGKGFKEGNNFSISIDSDSKNEADLIFKKLSEGGKITMPQSDTFWGSYFGSLIDQFGVNWMVSYG
ncbi:VOC family protein [Marinigracilibium pacificum]|uniref:VOC family protein n=1 Tax=Marinigracilibium pacificum TaxID=2729599 RepID=A0A848J274_9BACT|nr:VOC family protein [Marinigracilibium pacificum]NMM48584.1 VOC family protein [Marinigracilibium pacificum]